MFRWKHQRSRIALQCVFALSGLIFLTAQLSGKYYAFSSQPVFAHGARTAKSTVHSRDSRILSLDKRFKAQIPFALLIQPPRQEFAVAEAVTPVFTKAASFFSNPQCRVIELRGPPAFA